MTDIQNEIADRIVYEDNHIIVVNKLPGEIVQGDKSGDEPLVERVREYIRDKYRKPGNVFCGLVHRLDRPVGGLVIFAKTSKALSRLNEMLRNGEIHKTDWAISRHKPPMAEQTLTHYITTTERNNKSYASVTPRNGAKEARLAYRLLTSTERYNLIEVKLLTGRKHQIRGQLSAIGCPIRGDLKYGDRRSNPDGSISLIARELEFVHPVSKKTILLHAPIPDDNLWKALAEGIGQQQQDSPSDNQPNTK